MRLRSAAILPILMLLLVPASGDAQRADPWCFTGFHPGETQGTVWVPEGDLYCPLLADPKAERSFVSLLRGDFPSLEDGVAFDGALTIGSVGIGDAFPIVRIGGGSAGNGVQVGLAGSILAQFNMDAPSLDLINADYLIGIPITARWGGFSTRLRLYHQSSHLGDEFLLRTSLERENLSFESLELILSQEIGRVRVYGGGERLFNREPETLDTHVLHGGVEVRAGRLRGPRLLAAADVKTSEQHDWRPGWSARGGVEVAVWRDERHPPRLWSLLVEWYDGPSPYGQFFQDQVSYVGLGLHLTL